MGMVLGLNLGHHIDAGAQATPDDVVEQAGFGVVPAALGLALVGAGHRRG